MNIHKEGYKILLIGIVSIVLLSTLVNSLLHFLIIPVIILLSIVFAWMIWFFRDPVRLIPLPGDDNVYAPCDGKVVVIEKVKENTFFNEDRMQISIFMSPLDVHVNRVPVSGKIVFSKYYPGKFLVAWDPKSSTENERHFSVIDQGSYKIGVVQIAGAMARRILNYLKTGEDVTQGGELGFIRFGSRVDLYLPLDAKINVKINDVVKGNLTKIASVSI